MLVQLRLTGRLEQEELEELQLLAQSAGAEVCGTVLGSRQVPDAATFVGKGKAEEIREAAVREHAARTFPFRSVIRAGKSSSSWTVSSAIPMSWATREGDIEHRDRGTQ